MIVVDHRNPNVSTIAPLINGPANEPIYSVALNNPEIKPNVTRLFSNPSSPDPTIIHLTGATIRHPKKTPNSTNPTIVTQSLTCKKDNNGLDPMRR
uniref:Uncharacterized protein n=1 Tax=Arion vulgaris TaxID=1028688 RepID=A0A0B7AV55_9EUPU